MDEILPPPMDAPAPPPPPDPPPARVPWEERGVAGLFATIGMLLGRPEEAFRRVAAGGALAPALGFFGTIVVVAAYVKFVYGRLFQGLIVGLLNAAQAGLGDKILAQQANAMLPQAVQPLVLSLAFAALAVIWGAAAHGVLAAFGTRASGPGSTIRATLYAAAPFVVWLVPLPLCVDLVGWVWWIVLQILGIATVQRVGVARAAVAVLVPFVFLCACCSLAIGLAIAFGLGQGAAGFEGLQALR